MNTVNELVPLIERNIQRMLHGLRCMIHHGDRETIVLTAILSFDLKKLPAL